jgi:hypothetical protein
MAADMLTPEALRKRVLSRMPSLPGNHPIPIKTDTTDFYRIEYGDVLLLGHRPYLIRQNAHEGRFGIEEQEKFWVKRAIDLIDDERKFIKLVYHERFHSTIGGILFECFRSPRKEARILSLVRGHENFMQGAAIEDEKGNLVRVIDTIYGRTLADTVEAIALDHETYFNTLFPGILDRYIDAVRAIRFLHEHGEKHGDIRRDHLLVDRATDQYRWIDYDFNYLQRENPFSYDLFGLGNILMFLVGKGDVLIDDLVRQAHPGLARLSQDDCNIVFRHRVANLAKIHPYIPEPLNRILLHFSTGSNWYYETVAQLLEDLETWRS